MAPLNLAPLGGTLGYDLVFLFLGAGFGAVLEMSGFGDSRKLAAQFYLREMTVLKVMFTAIVVAAVLLALSSALGLLDLSRVWVNPTYLAPGIVGGLIMGVGFIIGGFCPGTSLVAASTLKLDGVFFVLGVVVGVFVFGETVHLFEPLFQSTALGRFTLPDWLGLPYGVVVILLVLMALAMFWGAELSEARFGERRPWSEIRLMPRSPVRIGAAVALLAVAGVTAAVGQPTVDDRWELVAADATRLLDERRVLVDPREVVDLKQDLAVRVDILDVRAEADFNRFHLTGARRLTSDAARDPAFVRTLLAAPDNTVVFVVSNGEADAARAWKLLKAQGVLNLYVIEGGINGWLDRYEPATCIATRTGAAADEVLAWRFSAAVGDGISSAHPDRPRQDPVPACALMSEGAQGETEPAYVKRVNLQRRAFAKGGCG